MKEQSKVSGFFPVPLLCFCLGSMCLLLHTVNLKIARYVLWLLEGGLFFLGFLAVYDDLGERKLS